MPSGLRYQRQAIETFFEEQVHPFGKGVAVDPTSNQLVESAALKADAALQQEVQDWCRRHPQLLSLPKL